MHMLLWIGFILVIVAIIPYIIFFIGINLIKNSKSDIEGYDLPPISIIISAYNEEKVIDERVENIRSSIYPIEKYEVIFVDDCSSDNTLIKAKQAFERFGINYRIIHNNERMGTNRSYNIAIKDAHNPIIVTTDADVFFEKKSLVYLIERLISDDSIAAVCGDLFPRVDASSRTAQVESAYRNYYGRMCAWESNIDSTYNFNGALVAFKKDLVSRIEDRRGADDANTAFEAIRRGYRAVYESNAVVYEDVPDNFSQQYRQKIRRATRLIEATLSNLDQMWNKRPFSWFFYPLRFYMYIITPSIFILGFLLMLLGLLLAYPLVFIGLVVILLIFHLKYKKNVLSAFILNQLYLFKGLMNLGSDMRTWESTSKK